jgi:hypothetical protein
MRRFCPTSIRDAIRLQNEEIYQGDRLDVVSPNMFAGSILDLEPDTEYEGKRRRRELFLAHQVGHEWRTARGPAWLATARKFFGSR